MRLVVGRVGRAHGIRGELTVEVRTDVPERRFVPGVVLHAQAPQTDHRSRGDRRPGPGSGSGGSSTDAAAARGGRTPSSAAGARSATPPERDLLVEGVRDHNGVLLVTFADVADRTQADELRNWVLEAEVPDTSDEEDAWYDHELVGLEVHDGQGRRVAEVVGLEHAPAQDLLVVRRPDGRRRYVPFVAALVPTVDVAGGRVVVLDPGGLITDLDGPDQPPGVDPAAEPSAETGAEG